jgi:hypothetical protein
MYPLSITSLLMALADDHRAARYILPLPAHYHDPSSPH